MPNSATQLQDFFRSGPHSAPQWLLLILLWPLSLLYGLVMRLRAAAYRYGLLSSHRAGVPVISIGNLTVGGTGKTPMVDFVVKQIIARDRTVAVVSRGYGGSYREDCLQVSAGDGSLRTSAQCCGDEPLLLARRNPQARVYVARKRRLGVMQAERDGAEVIVLDDAFQHLAVKRDLDIVLLDSEAPVGNGRLLPAGPLREPLAALARADMTVMTRARRGRRAHVPHVDESLCCRHRLAEQLAGLDGDLISWAELAGRRCLAFAGIARPHEFFDALRARGLELVGSIAFADHQEYTEQELRRLAEDCDNYDCLVTTEKDAVKLGDMALALPCYQVAVELDFDDAGPLEARLDELLKLTH